jgi:eukaryotic-like serine/threonine-protein kinase
MAADRNLLFGLLALQNGLIDQGQLVSAFQGWTLRKSTTLADQFVGRGDLDADQRAAIDLLVGLHLRKHGDDVEKSLAAVAAGKSTRESLERLADPDIDATLEHVACGLGSTDNGESERTASYAVGTATNAGQRFRAGCEGRADISRPRRRWRHLPTRAIHLPCEATRLMSS